MGTSAERRRFRRPEAVLATAVAIAVGAFAGAQAMAGVSPASYTGTLKPGESVTITKTVDVPEVPPKLDLALDVDLSGSYNDDLPSIKSKAPGIFDAVRAEAADSKFGLVSFVDFPFSPWGGAGSTDYGYRRDQAMTADKPTWLAAVNAMAVRFGGDTPESQYESLFQAATGAGREMPTTTDGDFGDPGEIASGLDAGFRADATRVIAITTDAPFHNQGDPGSSFSYPGASKTQTINALTANGIRVIAIKAPGSGAQMDEIATATGGSVVSTGSSSDEIATAILSGLKKLKFDVTATPVGCDPLELTYDPASHSDVDGGTSVSFQETIKVPAGTTDADLPPGGVVTCKVEFKAGDTVIGTQDVKITVDTNKPPSCSGLSATPGELWPPNHKLRAVKVAGATDPDADTLTSTITGVTQDEPVNGLGDGDTAPDAEAGASSDEVQVRAERSGTGDGRVYRIGVTVSDGQGGECTGTATVAVPHDQAHPAVDSGGSHDSFGS